MKYWGYLVAKLLAAGVFLYGLRLAIAYTLPKPELFRDVTDPFVHDLGYTIALMLFSLAAVGVLWAVIRDQRYRCRVCLRRLRMPIERGSWSRMLQFGRPEVEYICIYGHGKLNVPELEFSGMENPEWKEQGDMWSELFAGDPDKKK